MPQSLALNIGISGDRTEHLHFRILPKSQGGLGQLDAAALAPAFLVLMVGSNHSYAPEDWHGDPRSNDTREPNSEPKTEPKTEPESRL